MRILKKKNIFSFNTPSVLNSKLVHELEIFTEKEPLRGNQTFFTNGAHGVTRPKISVKVKLPRRATIPTIYVDARLRG